MAEPTKYTDEVLLAAYARMCAEGDEEGKRRIREMLKGEGGNVGDR